MDLAELRGEWSFRRRILDRSSGQFGWAAGRSVVESVDDGYDWTEAGTFYWQGREIPVTRRLLLRPTSDGWWVHFDDLRPFHPWRPGLLIDHPCGEDLYRGLIDPHDRLLRVYWDVTGPTKNLRIITRFRR